MVCRHFLSNLEIPRFFHWMLSGSDALSTIGHFLKKNLCRSSGLYWRCVELALQSYAYKTSSMAFIDLKVTKATWIEL